MDHEALGIRRHDTLSDHLTAAGGLVGAGGLRQLGVSNGRHPNSARFHALLKEISDLHDRKQGDYGKGDDPFANVRSSRDWGVKPWVGAMIRGTDKVKRLQSFVENGHLRNEGVADSLKDLAVYSLIALVLYEQEECATSAGAGR